MKPFLACAVVCLALALPAAAAAQFPLIQQPGQPRLPDPQELTGTRRAPLTITPSFTLTEEYNDNIFLDNDNRVFSRSAPTPT